MKNHVFVLLLVSVLFFSCKEKEPGITSPPPGERKVLVEEFTGVDCQGCPEGSAELENLLSIYPENLIVVSIHAGDFAPPIAQSTYDFRTPEAEDLISYLGKPNAYPSAVINRKDFDGGFYLIQYLINRWAGFIAEEIVEKPKVDVNISKTFDPVTRQLKVQVSGIANEDISGDLRLTILVKESNIINAQRTSSGVVEDYNHKHVFRTTLTDYAGDSFASEMNAGDNYDKTYEMILPEEWKASNCDVIAFVSLVRENTDKEVLQAEQVSVED